jgi:hypothetical protein
MVLSHYDSKCIMVLQEPFSILHRYAILTTSMLKIIWSHALAHFCLATLGIQYTRRRQTKQKHNTIYVGHHYAQITQITQISHKPYKPPEVKTNSREHSKIFWIKFLYYFISFIPWFNLLVSIILYRVDTRK